MSTAREYAQNAMFDLFESHGAFFAFGTKQFEEQKKEGVVYVSLGAGLVAPKENAKAILKGFNEINSNKIARDIKENGKEAIIQREFANYECHIGGDYSDAQEALESYGFTDEDFKEQWPIFMERCIEHDLF